LLGSKKAQWQTHLYSFPMELRGPLALVYASNRKEAFEQPEDQKHYVWLQRTARQFARKRSQVSRQLLKV